ncbi:MAG: glycosyltransferase [Paraglaciecola sp.]|nr:glycosyltransferase [Paraglaciecola sp.]
MTTRVLHIFGTMNRGGAEMRTVSLMAGMNEHNVQFNYCVLSGDKGVLDDQIRSLGGEIFYCKLGPTFIFRFLYLLSKRDFTVVHSHVAYVSGFILLLAKISGVKGRIAHFRNTTAGGAVSFIRRRRDRFLKFLIGVCATDILAVCDGAMVGFWGEHWLNEKRCKVIYNGFELVDRKLETDFWSHYMPRYDKQKIVINVARMDVQKNHLRQCDIFRELHKKDPNTFMVFIGKENDKRKSMMMTKINQYKLQDNVFFLGLQTEVLRFLQHADVMLFPSEWEGLPGVVLEAASVGLPVVASDLPGVKEISNQLPFIKIVKLQEKNIDWGTSLYKTLMQDIDPNQMIEAFKQSDFLIDTNIKQLHAIYSQ